MRIYLTHNKRMWVSLDENGTAQVGLTQEGLRYYGIFINFIPRLSTNRHVVEHQAIISIETAKCLQSLNSPVEGRLSAINDHVVDALIEVTPETWLFQLTGVKRVDPSLLNELA